MPHKLLNLLKPGCGLPDPPSGVWQDDAGPADFLQSFAECVDTTVAAALQDVHSVPSVYARPIIFDQAYRDARHPSHPDVIDQWRGLVAIFALQPWFGFEIKFKSYPIVPPPVGAQSFVGNVPGNGLHLNTMLDSMLPAPQGLWNPLRLIVCDRVVVGAVSPWTMVFTPASASAPASVPWARNSVLYDPISLFGANVRPSIELSFLHQWVSHVLAGWPLNLVGVPGRFLNAIQAELQAWQVALNPYLVPAMPATIPGLAVADPEAGPLGAFLRPSAPPVLAPLPAGAPARAVPPGEQGQSDVWLAPTRAQVAPVVVLKRNGMPPLTRIHNEAFAFNVNVNSLLGASGHGFTTLGGQFHPTSWMFADELFFPAKLAYVNLTGGLAAAAGPAAEFSLPLTPDFFRYFEYADVNTRLSVQISGAGDDRTLTATLSLPLFGGGVFPVQKTYSLARAHLAEAGAVTPGFVLWPDFYSETWAHNLAAFAGPAEANDSKFQAAPLYAGGKLDVASEVNGLERLVRIWECSAPPLGFSLTANGLSAGLVLRGLLSPLAAITPGTEWRIFVDFGTANTMISYQATGKPDINPLPITPRLLVLNDAPFTPTLKNSIAPPERATPPFHTLCYESDVTVIGQPGLKYTQLFEFLPQYVDRLVPNLKWEAGDAPLKAYLKSVVRLAVCEARASGIQTLQFKWSYPLALPIGPKSAMETFWNVLGNDFAGAAMNVNANPDQALDQALSESEAACRALAWFPKSPVYITSKSLCIVIDIGGGSTDYAFWCEAHLLDYLSFKLAANDVLRGDWIQKDPDFLKHIYKISTGIELPPGAAIPGGAERNKVEMWVNHVLSIAKNNAGVPFTDSMGWLSHPAVLRIFGGNLKSKPWVNVRTLAYIYLAGATYFAGLHAREFSTQLQTGLNSAILALGGRGSSLCAWVSNSVVPLRKVLTGCFLKGYGRDNQNVTPPGVTIVGSAFGVPGLPPLKSEVALGGLNQSIAVIEPLRKPIVGEINWRRQNVQNPDPWNKRLEVHEMADLQPPNNSTGADCYVNELISLLKLYRDGLNLDDDNLNNLAVDWAKVSNMLNLDIKATGVTQPVFAIELKALMEQYFGMC